jgi:hypothetical protein
MPSIACSKGDLFKDIIWIRLNFRWAIPLNDCAIPYMDVIDSTVIVLTTRSYYISPKGIVWYVHINMPKVTIFVCTHIKFAGRVENG